MPSRLLSGLLTLVVGPAFAFAQLPNPALDFVYPAGGQAGTQVVVQVGGRDLDEGQRLVFSHPGITGTVMTRAAGEFESGPQPIDNQFEVTIPLNVPPGSYDVRVVGRYGVSTPRTFLVGDVPELSEPGDHQTPDKAAPLPLDTVVHGRADGGAVDYYRFTARQGQTLVAECVAQQIGSALAPVITVWDAHQRQLARSKHLVDPILVIQVPADGDYILGINDHVFGGGATHQYRLRLYAGPYLVDIWPGDARPNTTTTFTVYGRNLPHGEEAADMLLQGLPLQRQQVALFVPAAGNPPSAPAIVDPVAATADGFVFRWSSPQGTSNELLVPYSPYPVITEEGDNNRPETAQKITVPCDYSGHFYPRRDQDWVEFTATKGQTYQVRVISHRLGHPTDPELFVQKVVKTADGQSQVSQVSTEDDFKSDGNRYRQPLRRGLELSHRDPVVRFTADQDTDYRVGLRDLNGSSVDDPRFDYRLVIEPQRPDFELLAWTQYQATDDDKKIDRGGMALRRAGTLPVMIDVLRQGAFEGEVRVSARQLPAGVTAGECRIGPGQSEGVLVLTATADAAEGCGPIQIVGEATVDGQTLERWAREAVLTGNTGNVEQNRPSARLARQMFLAVVGRETEPAEVALVPPAEGASSTFQTSLGAKLAIPLSYVKHAELKGDLALTPVGLPDKVKAEGLTLKPDTSDAQLQLTLDSGEIKPGTYTIFLRGPLKAVYARNPQAIELAQSRRTEFDGVIRQLDEQVKQADERIAQARQAAAAQTEELTKLEGLQQAVGQALEGAAQQVKLATDQLAGLQQGANSAQGERAAAIQKLADDVRASATEATAQVQKALAGVNQIKEQLADARTQLQSAQTEVAKAESDHKQLTERRQRADSFVKQLDQQLADAQKNFGPKEVTSFVSSPAITLEILKSPLVASLPAEPLRLKLGQSADVAVQIQRRFGFAEEVNLTLQVPDGMKDVSAEARTVDKQQDQATLQIAAGPNAPPGDHTLLVQTSLKFNGVDIQDRWPLPVIIEP